MKPVFYSTTQPADFVTLAQAREQVVHNPGDDDALLARYVLAAVEMVERDSGWMLGQRPVIVRWMEFTEREFTSQTRRRYAYRDMPKMWLVEMPLEVHPVTSVQAITYRNKEGAQVTLTCQFDQHHRPALLSMPPGQSWPDVQDGYLDSFQVECTAGLDGSTATRCSELARQAVLLLVGHWYENREAVGNVGKAIDVAYESLIGLLKLYRYP